jgi:hypothetical protein
LSEASAECRISRSIAPQRSDGTVHQTGFDPLAQGGEFVRVGRYCRLLADGAEALLYEVRVAGRDSIVPRFRVSTDGEPKVLALVGSVPLRSS